MASTCVLNVSCENSPQKSNDVQQQLQKTNGISHDPSEKKKNDSESGTDSVEDEYKPVEVPVGDDQKPVNSRKSSSDNGLGESGSDASVESASLPTGGSDEVFETGVNENGLNTVLVPSELLDSVNPGDGYYHGKLIIPARDTGFIFGTSGRNLHDLREKYQCKVDVNASPESSFFNELYYVVPNEHMITVTEWFQKKLSIAKGKRKSGFSSNILKPDRLRRRLPLSAVPVRVTGMSSLTELYVQVQDEEFRQFEKFQEELTEFYTKNKAPCLPAPVNIGAVCVIKYSDSLYCRAKIVTVMQDVHGCSWAEVFCLDYGGHIIMRMDDLLKIHARYLAVQFQAILVNWAHAIPLYQFDLNTIYSEYFDGKIIMAEVIVREELWRNDHVALFVDLGIAVHPYEGCVYRYDILGMCVLRGWYGLEKYKRIICAPNKNGTVLTFKNQSPAAEIINRVPYESLWIE